MAISTRSNQWICLLVFSLVISVQCVNSNIIHQTDIIPKIVIQSAIAKGAVCLDGSPPVYHLAAGKGEGKRNWLIYLSGGGWCMSNGALTNYDKSVESCASRATREWGSSLNMTPATGRGIFSGEESRSYFYNWNRVLVRYCDGGSYSGDADKPDPVTKLYYRGARIFQVVVDDLMAKGMKDAQNVILAGGSAGGLGVMVNCDRFTSLFSKGVRVKCLADSPLFIIVKNSKQAKFFKTVFTDVVALHQPGKTLPAECTSKMSPFECFQPKNLVQYVKSPLFIFQSAFDSFQVRNTFSEDLYEIIKNHTLTPSDMPLLQNFKQQIISALPQPSAKKGFIITSQYGHSFASATYKNMTMFADPKSKSIESAFMDWYFDKHPVNLIDPSNVPNY